MSESQTTRRSHHEDAPMPPPVAGRPYPWRLTEYETYALRHPDPTNYHRQRVPPGRPMWPWVSVLFLTIVGGLASLVVLAAEQSVGDSDPTATIDSAEITIDDDATTSAGTVTGVAAPTALQGDPYERYLELVEEWGLADADLRPDDALARAMIGCSSQWPTGTIEAALAEAYSEFLQPYRDQGFCQ